MERLDLALIRRHPELSRRRAREAIEKGQVAVDGSVVREAGRLVEPGSEVRFDPNRRALSRARCSLPILHQDDQLLIVDKPAGLLSVPTPGGGRDEDTALGRVSDYVRHLRPRGGFVGRVHRLDRDTSGALAFALSPDARAALIELFGRHRILRRYLALVDGRPGAESGQIDLAIRDAYRDGRRGVARGDEPAQPALTLWRVRERFASAALLEVELRTGRQHQIRAHLAAVGLPVAGDERYRPRDRAAPALGVPRQMLHAWQLGLSHPADGSPVQVESPLPRDFAEALARLRQASRERGR